MVNGGLNGLRPATCFRWYPVFFVCEAFILINQKKSEKTYILQKFCYFCHLYSFNFNPGRHEL